MQLITYISQLRSVLNDIMNSPQGIADSDLLAKARETLESTADFRSSKIDRSVLIQHMQWLNENFEGEAEANAVHNLRQLLGVKRHQITEKEGYLYFEDFILIHRGNEGDAETISAKNPHMPTLISILYDLYQCSDTIREGDEFELNGKVIAKCVDVHVVPTEGDCSVVLTNYTLDALELQELNRKYHVEVVDESGAPHFVVYKGKRQDLVKMIKAFWADHFASDQEMHDAISESPFLCVWGEGYVNPTTELKGLSFFCENNGYEEDDVKRIMALRRGQTLELLESGFHTIQRLY